MINSQYARIAVNIPQICGLFDYLVPPELHGQIHIGSLVIVPFGKQTVQGIVFSLPEEPAVMEPRPIESVLEKEPVVTQYQIKLAEWMAQENLTSLSACLHLMLPPGLSQHADVLLHLVNHEDLPDLSPLQIRIVNLLKKRGDLRGHQMDAALPRADWRKSLPGLVKRGIVQSQSILQQPAIRPKVIRTAQFLANLAGDENLKQLGRANTPSFARRKRVLDFLQEEAIPVNVTWVYAETGANSADLTHLAELGLILLSETEIWRDPLANLLPVFATSPHMTPEQELVVTHIKKQLIREIVVKPNLLQGVTSSGKTEVYLIAVEETLALGKQAIILVPEISLTPQTVRRFFARFPGKVGLIHSKLSPGERYDTWRRIRSGVLTVVVGARSALFAPMQNLGLIVIDECHDGSYHQEESDPRYHTVDAARAYAEVTASVLLLGSATPEVESLYQFQRQKWNLLKLPNRVLAHQNSSETTESTVVNINYLPLPDIEIVDMRGELVAGNRSALSRSLRKGIEKVLARHEQAILFLNRRGSASYVFCRDCGFVLKCSRCNTQLTYHENAAALICHQCNYQRQMPKKCPACASVNIRQFGMGTESLEKLVIEQFPAARVLRWDADTTRYKGAHDLILDHFSQRRADILIGTQMLAKGLDLPMVTLVGVVLADVSLNLPDFRAAERTFQILTQVAGRAGRSALGGRVVLQTFQPDHYAIQKASTYDFSGFEQIELDYRLKTGYPPFAKLIKLEFQHSNPVILAGAMNDVGESFNSWINEMSLTSTSMIGPAPCFYQRRAGVYRWQILLRGPNPKELLKGHPLTSWQPPGIRVEITVDPMNLL
ncbi:MAG: primosomal protein N' (replication factor Y) (superfamily II helicase) [Chloroflexi bacterium]|nr:MAG: primosomal protein N' (replication factor Y) (superfamily II helicase) [Chloroflexota bacterium]MBA4374942.1 primosomal protein N' [Anaerolinea sp.]